MNRKPAVITWTYGIDNVEQLFQCIKSNGFDKIQYCGDHNKFTPENVIQSARKNNLEILSYDSENFLPENQTDFSVDSCVDHYTDIINFAHQIKAPMVTLQGIAAWTKEINDYTKALDFVSECIKLLEPIASRYNIEITFEACNHYELPCVHTVDDLIYVKNKSGVKQLKFVLDSFHMNINEKDSDIAIRKAGSNLHSFHISDSGRSGMGTGHIDFNRHLKTLQEIQFDGNLFFEFVLPEIVPKKLPMNSSLFESLIFQYKDSLEKIYTFK